VVQKTGSTSLPSKDVLAFFGGDWFRDFRAPDGIAFSARYKLCLVYLKLFGKLYVPLTAGVLQPFFGDDQLDSTQSTPLDRRYRAVSKALDQLVDGISLKAA
jgi:hypothetical protein